MGIQPCGRNPIRFMKHEMELEVWNWRDLHAREECRMTQMDFLMRTSPLPFGRLFWWWCNWILVEADYLIKDVSVCLLILAHLREDDTIMLSRNQGPHHVWLISLSDSCMVFTKAVFNGLLAPLDFCYILIIFAGSVEFHSSPPRGAFGLSPRK